MTNSDFRRFQLIATPRSPFARRIRIALLSRNLSFEEQMTDVFQPSQDLLQANPLALVPVLFDPHTQEWIPDSDTILDVLDESPILAQQAVKPIWPIPTSDRAQVRVRSRLAAGIMTATVAHFLERVREGAVHPEVLAEHESASERALKRLESDLQVEPDLFWRKGDTHPTQAGWDLAIALAYLDLRRPEWDWRKQAPGCAAHLDRAGQLEVFQKTQPPKA
jgi:glutathione S-transferase